MDADITVAAIVGCAGLKPVMAAVEQGRTLALANKEALVSAGDVMNRAVRQSGATLLPVDSEHSAIFQCLDARMAERVSRIILTASGGPFRDRSLAAMQDISPAQAVAHPNWSMGAKISVDSATMMNKGLELIEAFHLFPVTSEQIEIVVHRQSVIHSMVEYVDGSVLAQLGTPDMRTPIACALAWPDRMPTPGERLDLIKVGRLDFEAPDEERFPALRLARAALNEGGGSPAILNAANEIAVAAFLGGRISYLEIAAIVSDTLDRFSPAAPDTLEAVLEVDREARVIAEKRVKGRAA
jgi:1-deoxy-D-xylulose-5-phosphate reductoisomerase